MLAELKKLAAYSAWLRKESGLGTKAAVGAIGVASTASGIGKYRQTKAGFNPNIQQQMLNQQEG